MSNLDNLVSLTMQVIEKRYEEDASQIEPLVYAYKDDQLIDDLPLDFDNESMKDLSAAAARSWITLLEADAAVFVSEAWVAEYPKGAKDNLGEQVMPSQHPNRVEIVIVTAQAKGRQVLLASKILRDDAGKFKGFEEYRRMDSSETDQRLEGRMMFFPQD